MFSCFAKGMMNASVRYYSRLPSYMEELTNHDSTKTVIEQVKTLRLIQDELKNRNFQGPTKVDISFNIGGSNINLTTIYSTRDTSNDGGFP